MNLLGSANFTRVVIVQRSSTQRLQLQSLVYMVSLCSGSKTFQQTTASCREFSTNKCFLLSHSYIKRSTWARCLTISGAKSNLMSSFIGYYEERHKPLYGHMCCSLKGGYPSTERKVDLVTIGFIQAKLSMSLGLQSFILMKRDLCTVSKGTATADSVQQAVSETNNRFSTCRKLQPLDCICLIIVVLYHIS